MKALVVVDVQNEFAEGGLRAAPGHEKALERIRAHVQHARKAALPIAWIQHFNKPQESRAFVPGTWGSEFSEGLGPAPNGGLETCFQKDVFGAFTGTGLEVWLRDLGVSDVLLVGFYTHMCLSTSSREALVRGFRVWLDPEATAAAALQDAELGSQTAGEVRRTALLQLRHMGAELIQDGFWTRE